MTSTTISPQARIAALVGVLVIALGGSAMFLLHSHTQPASVTTPPAHHPKPPKPVHVAPPTVNPLFPTPVRNALERHRLVVVGFFSPKSPTTMGVLAEARAGAAAAYVGFVPINVLNDATAGPLTALLPSGQILPNPGFILYERPGTILYRSDGYLDSAGVAQAVKDSR